MYQAFSCCCAAAQTIPCVQPCARLIVQLPSRAAKQHWWLSALVPRQLPSIASSQVAANHSQRNTVAETACLACDTPLITGRPYCAGPEALPAPIDSRVITKELAPSYVAALRFGGFPLDFEVTAAERRLREALIKDGLEPKAGYRYVVWSAPRGSVTLQRWRCLAGRVAGWHKGVHQFTATLWALHVLAEACLAVCFALIAGLCCCCLLCRLARYNEPWQPLPFRRNEVLIDLQDFRWT